MFVSLCCCLSTGSRQSFRPQAYLLFRPRSLSIPVQRAIDQGEIHPALVSLLVIASGSARRDGFPEGHLWYIFTQQI